MKKFAVILLITFVIALLGSACNKSTCPAYSKGEIKHTKRLG
jgi:hypothetical protein